MDFLNNNPEPQFENGHSRTTDSRTSDSISNRTPDDEESTVDNKENDGDNINKLGQTTNERLNLATIHDEINSNTKQFSRTNSQIDATSFVDVHPLSNSFMESNSNENARFNSNNSLQNSLHTPITSRTANSFNIPIIGYEVMEERARFTIYKLRIDDPRTGLSWMVFRRYTDFVRLYQKLKMEYRNLVLPLPEKRLFRNNFDPGFLEARTRGLQVFVNAVVKNLPGDGNVREFFCLDEPPPVGDSEPEAQALFGALEDTVGALKNQIRQQDDTLKYLRQKVFYLEEKMKACTVCNPMGLKIKEERQDSSSSSNCS